MQGITDNLTAGFETTKVPGRGYMFTYAAKYQKDTNTFFAQYHPLAPKDTVTLGYITKPGRHATFFGELRTGLQGFSETTIGFKFLFNSGIITGTLNSAFKATSTINM